MLVNETIIRENLFRMLSESSFIESSIFRFGVRIFYCRVRVSQTRVRARVRVFPESGFSSGPSTSPSPSPVRVSKYAVNALKLWKDINPIESSDDSKRKQPWASRHFQTRDHPIQPGGCVYCQSETHKSIDCERLKQ